MKKNQEFKSFQDGLRLILKANPETVHAAMEQEKKERKEERKAKRASSSPVSSSRDA